VNLDDFRVCVVPGDGIVARFQGAVLVVPFDGPVDEAALDRLLAACGAGPLGPRLAAVRDAAAPGVPSFALVAEADGGLAVHVEGDAQAAISGAAPVLHLSGRAPGWSNVFREPFAALAVGRVADGDLYEPPSRLDLQAGIVAGAGALLVPARASSSALKPAAAHSTPTDSPARPSAAIPQPAPPPTPAEPIAIALAEPGSPPTSAELIATALAESAPQSPTATPFPPADPTAAAGAPIPAPAGMGTPAQPNVPVEPVTVARAQPVLPVQSPSAPTMTAPASVVEPAATMAPDLRADPPAPAEPMPVEVWGIRCKKGHFNDPEARYCAMCGIHMVQDKAVRVKGQRPVLGYLVFDDGKTYKLDSDYVIGRDPHGDDAVQRGEARPLVFGAGDDVISDVHARITLRDWDVLVADCGSLYGTYVWAPGTAEWRRLADDQPVTLAAGSQVMLAQRGFMFQPVNKR
jgi:hypothetical protein